MCVCVSVSEHDAQPAASSTASSSYKNQTEVRVERVSSYMRATVFMSVCSFLSVPVCLCVCEYLPLRFKIGMRRVHDSTSATILAKV